MSDYQARSIADDKSDPSNFPEDNGLRPCKECGEDVVIDLMDAKMVEVEEFTSCYEHLSTVEELKEECFYKVRDNDFLKRVWATKDARIHELEKKIANLEGQIDGFNILVAKKDGQINELLEAIDFVKTCLDEKRGKA